MKRLIVAFLLSIVLPGLTPGAVAAAGHQHAAPGPDRPHAAAASVPAPRVAATRLQGGITVDGVLDEPAWAAATPITEFQLILQREGEAPSESTEVRVLIDDEHVYFAFRCDNRAPGSVRASLTPRDRITDGDHIAIHLDTYRDHRRAYIFGVNPYGVQLDGILDGADPDFSWDAVWDAEAARGPTGWTAEIAIPLRSIRFSSHGPGVWGLWIRREITKNDEVCSWPLWRRADQGDIMLQAGELTGLEGLRGGGRLEGEPYMSSIVTRSEQYAFSPSPSPALIRDHDTRTSTDVGADLRYSLTSTLVGNATVNPDFSQVEADAIQIDVNRRYPLFFPEKRPFFLEGADIFATPLDLVYTRRIADPRFGLKLTGKAGKLGIGAISLRDGGGNALLGVGWGESDRAARRGEFHVGRLTYDAGSNSRLGFLAGVHRSENDLGGVHADEVPGPPVPQGGVNLMLAGDSRLRLATNLFFIGELAWARTRVDSTSHPPGAGGSVVRQAIARDIAYTGKLRYADGTRTLELFQDYLGPDFRDELGFVQRVDMRKSGFNSNLFVRPENHWLRSMEPILNGYVIHDHSGGLEEWWVSPMIDWLLQRQTHVHTMYVRAMERWLDRDYDLNSYILVLDNTLWRPVDVSFEVTMGDGIYYGATSAESFRGWSEDLIWGVTLRPSPRLTSELSAERRRFRRGAGGPEIFDVWAIGAKTTFQFTRELYARVYPQYDTGGKHFDADALLAYVLSPGTVVYLGVNGDYDDLYGRRRVTRRSVFFKASKRFGV